MNEFIVAFLKKKEKEKAFDMVIGILMAILAILSFVLCIVYYEQIGQVLFYSLSIPSLLIFGFLAIYFFIRFAESSYLLSFCASKHKNQKEITTEIIETSRYTVDRHFDSYKVKGEGGFFYWAMPLGEVPLEEGKRYSLHIWDNWIVGWREEE